MNETHWSPRVARALHEFADATPLPPSIDGDSGVRRQRPQRKMALSIATAALLVVGAGGTAALLFRDASRSQSELPSSPIEPTVPAEPSIFDSGTSLIVWVHWEATPEQVQYIRNAILATGAVTPAELKYLDAAATFAEAQRIFADDPATLAYFKSHISTSFRLFPADPAFDPEQWRSEFAALPLVVDVAAPTDEPIAMVPADNVATEGSSAPETTAGEAPPETTAGEAP